MKHKGVGAMVPVGLTLVALSGLLVLDPFRILDEAFVKMGGAGREEAMVSTLYKNPETQEVSNGANPLESLQKLETYWCSVKDPTRFVLFGNSQTYTVLLAPQEQVSRQEERTYPDLLIDRLRGEGDAVRGYRLSAPNISYMEVLWYLHYLLTRPCLLPNEIIVQLNFENFRKSGVRPGMADLLRDPEFSGVMEAEARSSAPYAGTFQQAIDQYKSQLAQEKGAETGASGASKTGVSISHGLGGPFETRVRQVLDTSSTFRARTRMKAELLNAMYLARVHLLGIKPSTKRSIGGATLTVNVSSLERIGELCQQHGIRVVFFNAPQNPAAPLYRTEQDRQRYLLIVNGLSKKYAWRHVDFENSIPSNMWGVWIDGPDPIHFGRAAHQRMAELMSTAGLISAEK
jgi:hypothetical protein